MKNILLVAVLALVFLVGSVLADETTPKADSSKEADTTKVAEKADTTKKVETTTDTTTEEKEMPEWTTTESGLKWRDMVVGEGATAEMGTRVNCHYTLWLTDESGEKGKLVQSSKGGDPFQCKIGYQLIQGWSEGMVGMKEGGTRELIIHPAIGYGDRAMGDMIPANSTLYFEIVYLSEVKQ
jgi:FKBP-type peptidyl-prolyl cis-trans isomerase FkpA